MKYEGVRLTGMVSDDAGVFVTAPLPPGPYSFSISAKNYKDGKCAVTVGPAAPAAAAPPAPPPDSPIPGMPDPLVPEPKPSSGPKQIQLQCELDKMPRVGTLVTTMVDSETQAAVGGARVKITRSART